ncbi:hypothetical protein NUW54_g130 [Trametes sanguinea]|uniref:Uncharacterized protein n=1 Tax=Trametes sanguinea TaxID=158606 RepID=A0ACC1QBV4_9APHY|nr:hypothetical protein NUW54_g130 [Trametes sanguinea]
MPGTTIPPLPHYVPAPPTKEDLEWADLAVIDLSKASTPEGRAELAPKVRDAMRTYGFMYVVNHGLTQAQNDRIFDIADVPFSQVPEDEKKKFTHDIKATGLYKWYKLRQYWHIDNGVRDQIEHYNMHRQIVNQDNPRALQPFLPEIRAFAEHNHYNILHPILRLLARGMELPEETFVDMHGFDHKGEGWIRFMKYYPRTKEDEDKTKNVWLKGHMDFGTITILWSQPVSALQIMSPDGKWRWVKHMDNALVINAGEAMEFLSRTRPDRNGRERQREQSPSAELHPVSLSSSKRQRGRVKKWAGGRRVDASSYLRPPDGLLISAHLYQRSLLVTRRALRNDRSGTLISTIGRLMRGHQVRAEVPHGSLVSPPTPKCRPR